MGQEYRRTTTIVSLINYHFVFCPRYRRKVLVGEVEKRFKELLPDICREIEVNIVALEVMPDHVHVFLNCSTINQSVRHHGKSERSDFEKAAAGM